MAKTKKARIGKLPPRYSFILNQHQDTRLSKCPVCGKATFARKFAFLLHIEGLGFLALGKTCKYCAKCELIMVHQDELEAELAYNVGRVAPEIVGNEYLVIGTVDKAAWQQGLRGNGHTINEMFEHLADFKKVYDLQIEPGGWFPADEKIG